MDNTQEKISKWRERAFAAGYYRKLGVFADEIGVSHNTLTNWFYGRSIPRADMVDKVEALLIDKGV